MRKAVEIIASNIVGYLPVKLQQCPYSPGALTKVKQLEIIYLTTPPL